MEYLILFLPLVAAIISGFFGRLIGDRFLEILTSLFVSISAILSFVVFYKVINDISGQIFTLFILTVAAAEAAIGLAIIVVYYRNSGTIRVEEIDRLKG